MHLQQSPPPFLLPFLLLQSPIISAFQITFPTKNSYWVACNYNTLTWKTEPNDPVVFSVQLKNQNQTRLNADYALANSVPSFKGSTLIYLPCLDSSDGYSIYLISPNHPLGDHHDPILANSTTFEVKPKETPIDPQVSTSTSSTTQQNSSNRTIPQLPIPSFATGTNLTMNNNTTRTNGSNIDRSSTPSPVFLLLFTGLFIGVMQFLY